MTSPSGRVPLDVALLRSVFDAVGAAVYVVDTDGLVQASNPHAEQVLGYPEAEIIGRSAHSLFHYVDAIGRPRTAHDCAILAAVRAGVAGSDDNDVFTARDGALVPVAWNATPLITEGGLAGGVVVFRDITMQVAAGLENDLALELAHQARAESRAEVDQVRFLADVSAALTSTLEPEETARRLARLVVPRFADWCVVDLLADDLVHCVSVAHRRPGELGEVGEPTDPDAPGGAGNYPVFALPHGAPTALGALTQVLHGGPSIMTHNPGVLAATSDALEAHRGGLFARFGATSIIIVGLNARHRTLGALTLVRTYLGAAHGPTDLVMAEDIARRAALALDNARLYNQQRTISETLQRSLLPAMPTSANVALGATYVATTTGTEIGGDWYDAFVLPDGATAMVLGDVAGHDLRAAVRMSDIRGLLRAASLQSADPGEVLDNLDAAMTQFTPGVTATAIYARVERTTNGGRRLRWASAGHPPPLLVSELGTAEYLDSNIDPLLGTGTIFARATSTTALPSGSTIVFYSDGLIEDRTTGLDVGLAMLRRTAAGLGRSDMSSFCDHLVAGVGHNWHDDVAVIAARFAKYQTPGVVGESSHEEA